MTQLPSPPQVWPHFPGFLPASPAAIPFPQILFCVYLPPYEGWPEFCPAFSLIIPYGPFMVSPSKHIFLQLHVSKIVYIISPQCLSLLPWSLMLLCMWMEHSCPAIQCRNLAAACALSLPWKRNSVLELRPSNVCAVNVHSLALTVLCQTAIHSKTPSWPVVIITMFAMSSKSMLSHR